MYGLSTAKIAFWENWNKFLIHEVYLVDNINNVQLKYEYREGKMQCF